MPTVEALAYNLYDTQGLICPIMDARRNQVYTGIYRFKDHRLQTVEDQMAVPIEELLAKLEQYGERVTFLGDGVPVFRKLIQEKLQAAFSFAPAHANRQRAAAVASLGLVYYEEGKYGTAEEHVPDYLRVSQAERERAEREKSERSGGCTMTFREMLVEDLEQVVDIEQNLFSVPWTKEGFLTYLMKK